MPPAKTSRQPRRETRFFNRELSWLEFNQRVLDEALDERNPLLERLKFFCIVNSNLDEFFEVRVAGLKQMVAEGLSEPTPDGLTAAQTLAKVRDRVRQLVSDANRCWREEIRPALDRHDIRFLEPSEVPVADREWLETYYRENVSPVLTPLAIDPSHPFPSSSTSR